MKQLDLFWELIRPILDGISEQERKTVSDSYSRLHKRVAYLERNFSLATQDRAAVHALLKKTSEDLIQRYQILFEHSGTAMAVINEDGTVSLVNSFFEQLSGYSHEEVVNKKNIFDFIEKEYHHTMISYHQKRKQNDQTIPNNYEAKVVTRDGDLRDVVVSVGLFPGKTQSIISLIDISERKKAEVELSASEERYRLLLQNINDGVIVYDASRDRTGRILEVNDCICDLSGYSREELLSMTIDGIKPAGMPEQNSDSARQGASKTHAVFESEIVTKKGEHAMVEVSSRLFDLQGRKTVLEIIRDITERKMLQSEMEYYTSELTERAKAIQLANNKLNLLSRITRHDINNQMTLMLGLIEVMRDECSDPIIQQYLEMELKAARNIQEQIKFTREYQEIGVHSPIWFNVRDVIMRAAQNLPLSKIALEIRLNGVEIYTDPLIEKVFYTLLEDSLRHGEKVTWITCSYRTAGEDLVIICEDDGVGVPAAYKEDIFRQKYYKHSGYGLLLSVSILEMTGITITETGEEGVGARFEITVPAGAYRIVGND